MNILEQHTNQHILKNERTKNHELIFKNEEILSSVLVVVYLVSC